MNNTEKKQDNQPAIITDVDSTDDQPNSSNSIRVAEIVNNSEINNTNKTKIISDHKNFNKNYLEFNFFEKIISIFQAFYNKQNTYIQRVLLVMAFVGAQALIFSLVQLTAKVNQQLFPAHGPQPAPQNTSATDNKSPSNSPNNEHAILPNNSSKSSAEQIPGQNSATTINPNQQDASNSTPTAPVLEVKASSDTNNKTIVPQVTLRSEHASRERTERSARQFNFQTPPNP